MILRPNGRVSEEKRCGPAQSSPVANIWMKKVSAPLTRKNLVGNHSRIAERLLYERMIVREPGPQIMETVTEKVAKATIPFLKAWNLSFSMMYDGHLTRVAVLSYDT